MPDRRLEEALRHLDPPAGFKPWHGGASVLGSLRGVTAGVAAWKPYPDRHSIWELALHIAYWNYAVWRRLTDADQGGFPRGPSNWPAAPDPPDEAAWADDRRLVREWHDRLVSAVGTFDAGRLDEVAGEDGKTRTTYADLVTGIVLHDTYHAGQIQLMKRLARSAGVGGEA
jgi:uncharacterized damage-inducible protein DinB